MCWGRLSISLNQGVMIKEFDLGLRAMGKPQESDVMRSVV